MISPPPLNPHVILQPSGWFVNAEGEFRIIPLHQHPGEGWGVVPTVESYQAYKGLQRYMQSVRPPERRWKVPEYIWTTFYEEGRYWRLRLKPDENGQWEVVGQPEPQYAWTEDYGEKEDDENKKS